MRKKSCVFLCIIAIILFSLYACRSGYEHSREQGNSAEKTVELFEAAIFDGREYRLGMNLSELPPPDEVLRSLSGFDWLIYGTETYENFYALGVKDAKLVAMASSGLGFEYKGVRAGKPMHIGAELVSNFYVDRHDDYKVHAFFVSNIISSPINKIVLHDKALFDEAKLNFHFTNAFRVYHGLNKLKWSSKAATAARLHSEDMANSNYFDHQDLGGTFSLERMQKQGILAWKYGENIAGGYSSGFKSYCAWINSSEHRVNVVGNYTRLGVGLAINEQSKYLYYQTQNFYSTQQPEKEE